MEDIIFKRAYGYACKLLKLKDRSEHEIIQRLEHKGFDEDIILKVIEKLRNNLYIDDRKFALNYVERQLKKLKSVNLIIKELKEKYNISEEILESIELLNYRDKQLEILKNSLSKKFKAFNEGKLYRYLQSRGFEEKEIEFLISYLKK